MCLDDWLARLEHVHPLGQAGIELGLERIAAVKIALGHRQVCPLVTVAGTNGKGSTCAMLERILRAAGYRTGLYTSPHLLRFSERIRIDGGEIADDALVDALERVDQARLAAGNVALTYFEFATLAAWEAFARAAVDVVILEVGLGGRLDATNLYAADCAILTTVDLDHTAYLGTTREAIGREKSAIAREARPLICGDAAPPDSVADSCRAVGADFWQIGKDFGYRRQESQWQWWRNGGRSLGGLAFPALRGGYQLSNASCVLAALDALKERLPVSAQEIRCGLAEVELAGRCQVLPGRPQIVLDVAHNPQAARTLAENLGDIGFARNTWAVFGMLADKDAAAVVAALANRVDHWLCCELPGPRAATAASLLECIEKVGAGKTAQVFPDVAGALHAARERAQADDRILAFGSFLTVAGVLTSLGRKV